MAWRHARRAFSGAGVRPCMAPRLWACDAHDPARHSLAEPYAVPDGPLVPDTGVCHADRAADPGGGMALILELIGQGVQVLLVLALAPLVLGITRKVKAHALRRVGPPLWQPYLDIWK